MPTDPYDPEGSQSHGCMAVMGIFFVVFILWLAGGAIYDHFFS